MSERLSKLRNFSDDAGIVWRVCELSRTAAVDARPRDRRAKARVVERAFPAGPRVTLRPAELPWLCFESATERRRVSPAPDDWHELPESELLQLLEHSQRL